MCPIWQRLVATAEQVERQPDGDVALRRRLLGCRFLGCWFLGCWFLGCGLLGCRFFGCGLFGGWFFGGRFFGCRCGIVVVAAAGREDQ